jgi:hypothetical protein
MLAIFARISSCGTIVEEEEFLIRMNALQGAGRR